MERPRGRGGRRQRAERDGHAAHNERASNSELARFLVLQVLWGHISASFAKKVAMLAKSDFDIAIAQGAGFSFDDLNMLASLNCGAGGGHAYSALISKVGSSAFEAFSTPLPLNFHENNTKYFTQYMLLPHETFSVMFHKCKEQ